MADEKFELMEAGDRAMALSGEKSVFLNVAKFEQMQRVSTMLSQSDFVPAAFRGKVGNCIIALDLAERLGAHPLMLMQSMYIVHGRPGFEGKLMSALVNNSGRYKDPLEYEWKGTPGTPEWGCRAHAVRKSTGKQVFGPWVDWKMVKAEGWDKPKGSMPSKWATMPELMFMYRSASFFCNTNDADLKMGMQSLEELEDIHQLVPDDDGTYSPEKEFKPGIANYTPTQETPPATDLVKDEGLKTNPGHPFDKENWFRLKSPGMIAFAEKYADAWDTAPDEMKEAFRAKWLVCEGTGDFPFDRPENRPPEEVAPKVIHPEDTMVDQLELNEIFVSGNRDGIDYATKILNLEPGVRPTGPQVPAFLIYYKNYVKKNSTDEGLPDEPKF